MLWQHKQLIDLRTGTILERHGLVVKRDNVPISEGVITVLNDPEHEKRLETQPGPIVCHMTDDETQRSVVFVEEFLLAEDAAARRGIWAFRASKGPFRSCPHSRECSSSSQQAQRTLQPTTPMFGVQPQSGCSMR